MNVTERLLTSEQAAELMGMAVGTFLNNRKKLDLQPIATNGCSNLYDPNDIAAAKLKRTASKAARKSAPRTPKEPSLEQANETMLEGIDGPKKSSFANIDLTLTASEEAVVWAGHLAGTLGDSSRWHGRTPPTSYRRSYLAHEAARQRAQLDLEAAA